MEEQEALAMEKAKDLLERQGYTVNEPDKQLEITTVHKRIAGAVDLDKEYFPLPLSVLPNHMGINLSSVEGMTWTKLGDGQLVNLTVHFVPAQVDPHRRLDRAPD